jgi:hypothetical protein
MKTEWMPGTISRMMEGDLLSWIFVSDSFLPKVEGEIFKRRYCLGLKQPENLDNSQRCSGQSRKTWIPGSIATAKAVRTRLAELTRWHFVNNQIVRVDDECDSSGRPAFFNRHLGKINN